MLIRYRHLCDINFYTCVVTESIYILIRMCYVFDTGVMVKT